MKHTSWSIYAAVVFAFSFIAAPQSLAAQDSTEEKEWDSAITQFDHERGLMVSFLKKYPNSTHLTQGREMLSQKREDYPLAKITSTSSECAKKIAYSVQVFSRNIDNEKKYYFKEYDIARPLYEISIPADFFLKNATYITAPIGSKVSDTPIENLIHLDILKRQNECSIIYRWSMGVGLPECTCEILSK